MHCLTFPEYFLKHQLLTLRIYFDKMKVLFHKTRPQINVQGRQFAIYCVTAYYQCPHDSGVLTPQMVTLPLIDCPCAHEASDWPLVA